MRKGYTAKGSPITLTGSEVGTGDKAPEFKVIDHELNEKTLADFRGKVKVITVTPSLDTSVCSKQLRRFNKETAKMGDEVALLNISMDLPFAIDRFREEAGIDRAVVLSDHREASFGKAYGLLIDGQRLLMRSVIVMDRDDTIRYMEIVKELTDHPDYDAALTSIG